ncbi:DUF3168 domain-containing protein [Novosphingobium sp. FSY-8]|uniref:DUF3168 domain-containing protein n=1 Tax=Novosphingobium ovatum TaxID=1908523 RepID=A0ABW9XGR8_9SPHN|nr:DUF3168 domain-containing protein [Novosphingobium ovatum]NBC37691.1 DUF3168 domain-containing protein [Novosphingobium ovatum]
MEIPLRAALIAWLAGDATLATSLNAVTEEAPSRTSLPWLSIAASASADWSTKTETGYETRIALELHCRGDRPDSAATLVQAIQDRIKALPRTQDGFAVIGIHFLRARAEQRGESQRLILLEYRFRTLNA